MIRRLLTLSIAVAASAEDAPTTTMDNVKNFYIPFWLDQRKSA